jgi:hypothetical protein
METKPIVGARSLIALLLAGAVLPALATNLRMPPEQQQGAVRYVSGGIGEGESRLFEQRLSRYPLAVELVEKAGKRDAFTSDSRVRITDAHGHTVLATQAGGPFLLVDLAPGRYAVEATLNDTTLRKHAVLVRAGQPARATFVFPAHTD